MDIFGILALGIFGAGYALITLEHKLSTNKSAIALAIGSILWILLAATSPDKDHLTHVLHDTGAEIFSIIAFLLAAMAIVEILAHYRFFDLIRMKLMKMKLNDKRQFVVMGILTFFLSALLDNLTITIVMVQIARQFFVGKNLLIAVAGIVILANAGGAWSPIGDVTTIMLWLADKFTVMEIITHTLVPSMVIAVVSGYLLLRQMIDSKKDAIMDKGIRLSKGEKTVITACLVSFTFPLFMNLIGLPPYLGLLLGLGIVWCIIEYAKYHSTTTSHLKANIDMLLQKTDISSLKFFIGILLAVAALNTFGVLEIVSVLLFGANEDPTRLMTGTAAIGLLSAIVDNVPLTALSIDLIESTNPFVWTFMALAVGTGGSALIIGSVAGVVAMGMVKELNFGNYLKIATIPAVVGYIAGLASYVVYTQLVF